MDRSPEQLAKETGYALVNRARRWVRDVGTRFASIAVLKLLGIGGATAVIGFISLPLMLACLLAAFVIGGGIWLVFAHKAFYEQKTMREWAVVAAKRLEQQKLRAEKREAEAVLLIVGDPKDRGVHLYKRRPELGQAIAWQRQRLLTASADQNARPAGAHVRAKNAPGPPNLDPVRAQIRQLDAELNALEAEIQALALPEARSLALKATEARAHVSLLKDRALKARQAARERHRAGLPPTAEAPGMRLQVQVDPLAGHHAIEQLPPEPTPEQIAHGGEPAAA